MIVLKLSIMYNLPVQKFMDCNYIFLVFVSAMNEELYVQILLILIDIFFDIVIDTYQ